MTYEHGAALATANAVEYPWLGLLITDGIVLARRHGRVQTAARLMGVSEPGLPALLTRPRDMPRFQPDAAAGRKADRRTRA